MPTTPARTATVEVSVEEQRRIDDAILQGVGYLKKSQLDSGSWLDQQWPVGHCAMPALTLLECGVSGSDPVIRKAADFVRQRAAELPFGYNTYQRAVAILFLDRLGEDQDQELIQHLGLCLLSGQNDDGGWGYDCPLLRIADTRAHLKSLNNPKQTLVQWRTEARTPGPVAGLGDGQLQHAVRRAGPVGRATPRRPHRPGHDGGRRSTSAPRNSLSGRETLPERT